MRSIKAIGKSTLATLGVLAILAGGIVILPREALAQAPFSAQIQAALRVFLRTAHTWTALQTFSGGASISTGPLLLSDGTAAAPSLAFASQPFTGMWNSGGPSISWSVLGTESLKLTTTYVWPKGGAVLFGTGNTQLIEDAANTLALRNGTNAQTFNIYRTFTNSSNYERLNLAVGADGTNDFTIFAQNAGTGAARGIGLRAGTGATLSLGSGSNYYWMINTSGHWVASSDNANDIGAAGATRPRTVYVGTGVVAPLFVYPGSTPGSPNNGETWIDTAAGNWTTAATTINLKARNNGTTRTIASVTF